MPDRPVITVERRRDIGWAVTCTHCGDVASAYERPWLATQAHRHAQTAHDGDVDRSGWV